jgi:hypothetical protein
MTTLEIKNATHKEVSTYITLGATPGCVQDVGLLSLSHGVQITKLYDLAGVFNLPAHTTLTVTSPEGLGLNGNFSFDTPPLNCPCPDYPEGVNLAEFIINNGFQTNGQETVDISCVCGANAFIEFELSESDWTSDGGQIKCVESIANRTRYRNTGLVGVYPYGCDVCTGSISPPACVGLQPQNANIEPICNVQRNAATNMGGKVVVIFNGFTPVPA